MRLLRSALFNLGFYLLIIVLMIAALPALAQGGEAIEWHARRWARLSLALLERTCGTKVEFRGLENLPSGAALVAAKHQSTLDVLALVLASSASPSSISVSSISCRSSAAICATAARSRSTGKARRRSGANCRRRGSGFHGRSPAGDFSGRHAPPRWCPAAL